MDQGQAPAAPLKCHHLRFNALLMCSSVSAQRKGRKCKSTSIKQVEVTNFLSQNMTWILQDTAGDC